ncbi:MFS transporter [Nocardioides zeae]|uniref:MFS transporter n=1 Tax=Nocardioides imazamoxiresistens TaxID=3231893 RepID=A0ABU3PZV4_9ACTN|nr:MFS transporter [Nocardioides zeae]MDT9594285.1 MFS transporter [Nocardioides zeae]
MSSPHGTPHEPPGHGPREAYGAPPPADPQDPHGARAGEIAARTAKATGRGVAAAARGTARFGRFTFTQARRASHAEGAGASGLSRIIELHAFNAAGDAAVAISLAGTLFFQVPDGEARGQVAQFLALTMLPFAIVAPLIGPFLDRFSHGRRWAVGGTMAIRAFLCWVLAGAVLTGSTWLFPAALGVLVASKAYGVTRAAAVPRVVPAGLTLVKANGRVSLAGVVGAGVSAPLAGLASLAGPEWSLRYAFVIFVIATILAILLPRQVDASHGETRLSLVAGPSAASAGRDPGNRRKASLRMPPAVAFALRANCGPRWLSGFLTMFVAFLLTTQPFGPGWSTTVLFALIIGAAGLGNTLGIALASLLKNVNPAVTVVVALLAAATVATLAAVFYSVVTLSLLGLTAGLAQSLAKLSLDSTIQHDVHERVRTSALARSDTLLQFAWVVGGFVGIAVPLGNGRVGLTVAAVVLVAWSGYVLGERVRGAARRRAEGPSPSERPGAAAAGAAAGPASGPATAGPTDDREHEAYPGARPRPTRRYAADDRLRDDHADLDDDGLPPTQPYNAARGEAGRTTIVMPPEPPRPFDRREDDERR